MKRFFNSYWVLNSDPLSEKWSSNSTWKTFSIIKKFVEHLSLKQCLRNFWCWKFSDNWKYFSAGSQLPVTVTYKRSFQIFKVWKKYEDNNLVLLWKKHKRKRCNLLKRLLDYSGVKRYVVCICKTWKKCR